MNRLTSPRELISLPLMAQNCYCHRLEGGGGWWEEGGGRREEGPPGDVP